MLYLINGHLLVRTIQNETFKCIFQFEDKLKVKILFPHKLLMQINYNKHVILNFKSFHKSEIILLWLRFWLTNIMTVFQRSASTVSCFFTILLCLFHRSVYRQPAPPTTLPPAVSCQHVQCISVIPFTEFKEMWLFALFYVVCNFSLSPFYSAEAAGFLLWKLPLVWFFKRWHPHEPVQKCEHFYHLFSNFTSLYFDGKHRFSTKGKGRTKGNIS